MVHLTKWACFTAKGKTAEADKSDEKFDYFIHNKPWL